MIKSFLLSFIPIFVAMDAIGVMPMYLAFTEHLKKREKRRIITQSMITAFLIGIIFLFLGTWIFKVLGVMVSDFKIAGGSVLLAIALRDILQRGPQPRLSAQTMGAVPIGTPLVTGPAVLTTIVMMVDTHGLLLTVSSFIANLAITWVVFLYADNISNILGRAGSKAVSKIAHLLLAAIAVMMIRKGLVDSIAYFLAQKTA
ncbi:MAG: MarC family protein [Candidatus Omnitrophica bacterium]|nr:MarC family protein [Candidatus Omnitrophota bacterium]MCM8790723.1 MarC family protein [Candidatus Omnitrophota bacterium]